jgi:hypothetical protein
MALSAQDAHATLLFGRLDRVQHLENLENLDVKGPNGQALGQARLTARRNDGSASC